VWPKLRHPYTVKDPRCSAVVHLRTDQVHLVGHAREGIGKRKRVRHGDSVTEPHVPLARNTSLLTWRYPSWRPPSLSRPCLRGPLRSLRVANAVKTPRGTAYGSIADTPCIAPHSITRSLVIPTVTTSISPWVRMSLIISSQTRRQYSVTPLVGTACMPANLQARSTSKINSSSLASRYFIATATTSSRAVFPVTGSPLRSTRMSDVRWHLIAG
jgi:hypothetical protein